MRYKYIFSTFILCLMLGKSFAQHNGMRKLANDYFEQKEWLLSYKHYLAYKYLNYEWLNRDENDVLLSEVDKKIHYLEKRLNASLKMKSVHVRGWSDKQIDSLMDGDNIFENK